MGHKSSLQQPGLLGIPILQRKPGKRMLINTHLRFHAHFQFWLRAYVTTQGFTARRFDEADPLTSALEKRKSDLMNAQSARGCHGLNLSHSGFRADFRGSGEQVRGSSGGRFSWEDLGT